MGEHNRIEQTRSILLNGKARPSFSQKSWGEAFNQ
jgi:hypothetical protein